MPYNIPMEALGELIDVEVIMLKKTGIPRCIYCLTDFAKIEEHTWKPTCKCIKPDLRLCKG